MQIHSNIKLFKGVKEIYYPQNGVSLPVYLWLISPLIWGGGPVRQEIPLRLLIILTQLFFLLSHQLFWWRKES